MDSENFTPNMMRIWKNLMSFLIDNENEEEDLKQLGRKECIYTESYSGPIKSSSPEKEYCIMLKKYHEILPGIKEVQSKSLNKHSGHECLNEHDDDYAVLNMIRNEHSGHECLNEHDDGYVTLNESRNEHSGHECPNEHDDGYVTLNESRNEHSGHECPNEHDDDYAVLNMIRNEHSGHECLNEHDDYVALNMTRNEHSNHECLNEHDDYVVVELDRLCDSKSPRKWLDYVFYYSTGKRTNHLINDEMFLGIAMYSHFYDIEGKGRVMLIDNIFRLYIRPLIVNNRNNIINCHNKIYPKSDESCPNSELCQSLVEGTIKNVLIKLLRVLKMPFGIEGHNLNVYQSMSYTLDGWCEKRIADLMDSDENSIDYKEFDNVVIKHLPKNYMFNDEKVILLALIGMIRTGNHVISVDFRLWFSQNDFKCVDRLVNTNRNLVGATNLNSRMDLNEMLKNTKHNINYLEAAFGLNDFGDNRAINFINSIDCGIEMTAVFEEFDTSTMDKMVKSEKVHRIRRLDILDAEYFSRCPAMWPSISNSPKVEKLRIFDTKVSLSEFLVTDFFKTVKSKLNTLEVSGIGNLKDIRITKELLSGLRLERLEINLVSREIINMEQLRDIITRDGFKILIFRNVHLQIDSIIDLKNSLGARKWPVILTDFEPDRIGMWKYYAHACGFFYEIYSNSQDS